MCIRDRYHTELFPDSILRTESPLSFIENEPRRNALSKVYISHSLERNLKPGDIIVFYRTGGYYAGVATTIGIVESVKTDIKDENELILLCRKRTVFKAVSYTHLDVYKRQALKCPMWRVPEVYNSTQRTNREYFELLNQNGFEYNVGNNGCLLYTSRCV